MGAHLCQVILHDIPDDAKLIKVPSAALCAKGLLEANLHIGDEVSVPCGRQELVGKSACSTHALTYMSPHSEQHAAPEQAMANLQPLN